MAKVKNSVWGVFWQGIMFYFTNFGSFFKYMSFPVFGQLVGIILIVAASYFYSQNLTKMIIPGGFFDNFTVIFLMLFIVILPGFIVLVKAFWDYLVAYGAINSMLDNMLKSGRVYDFHAHTELIARRSASFGLLWLTLAILGLLAVFPFFWVIAGILFVYFVLVFQVFTYEPDKSIYGCYKKSFEIIKGNFWKTLGLMVLLGLLTYWTFPTLFKILFEFLNITNFLAIPVDAWAQQLPIEAINKFLIKTPLAYQIDSITVAKFLVSQLLIYTVESITLPLRVICWGLWYKSLNKPEVKIDKKLLKRAEEKD